MSKVSIDLANEKLNIAQVCRWIGSWAPDEMEGRSRKIRCPLGEDWHTDGGHEKSMRIYPDSNSVYCYAGCGKMGPVALYARYHELSSDIAASQLLDRIGYRPPSPAERWRRASQKPEEINRHDLGLTLRTYCERISQGLWKKVQFEDEVAEKLDKCLSLLDFVVSTEQAHTWLNATKAVMAKVIGREASDG